MKSGKQLQENREESMGYNNSEPIKIGNPRGKFMLAYHRQCMTTCIKTMWEDSLMAEHRQAIEPMLAKLACDGDIYEAFEDANEYFGDGVWDDPNHAKECHTALEGWMAEYHALWEKLNSEELKALRTILDSENAKSAGTDASEKTP